MKLVIAHLPHDAFASVRDELLDLGVLRMTVNQVHSASPQSAMTLRYRAATLSSTLRSEMRLECVISAGQLRPVVDVLRMHVGTCWGLGGRVAVLDLEELHEDAPTDHLASDDPRLDSDDRDAGGAW